MTFILFYFSSLECPGLLHFTTITLKILKMASGINGPGNLEAKESLGMDERRNQRVVSEIMIGILPTPVSLVGSKSSFAVKEDAHFQGQFSMSGDDELNHMQRQETPLLTNETAATSIADNHLSFADLMAHQIQEDVLPATDSRGMAVHTHKMQRVVNEGPEANNPFLPTEMSQDIQEFKREVKTDPPQLQMDFSTPVLSSEAASYFTDVKFSEIELENHRRSSVHMYQSKSSSRRSSYESKTSDCVRSSNMMSEKSMKRRRHRSSSSGSVSSSSSTNTTILPNTTKPKKKKSRKQKKSKRKSLTAKIRHQPTSIPEETEEESEEDTDDNEDDNNTDDNNENGNDRDDSQKGEGDGTEEGNNGSAASSDQESSSGRKEKRPDSDEDKLLFSEDSGKTHANGNTHENCCSMTFQVELSGIVGVEGSKMMEKIQKGRPHQCPGDNSWFGQPTKDLEQPNTQYSSVGADELNSHWLASIISVYSAFDLVRLNVTPANSTPVLGGHSGTSRFRTLAIPSFYLHKFYAISVTFLKGVQYITAGRNAVPDCQSFIWT